jgi:hypothetical protein
MTGDERREWLAGLRPGDRVAFTWGLFSVRGCYLMARMKRPYPFAPDDPLWDVSADADVEIGVEEQVRLVRESRLVPLPFPGMTGFASVAAPPAPKRRRARRKPEAAASA